MILELHLGNGHPRPTHGGDGAFGPGQGQGQGQGGGKPPAEPGAKVDAFEVAEEASTVQPPEAEASGDNGLAAAAASLAGVALAVSDRNVRTFDPATGRFTARPSESRLDREAFEGGRFVPATIDW